MADDPSSLRRRADQLRNMLRSVTDPRAIEVLKSEIVTLETKAQQIEKPPRGKP